MVENPYYIDTPYEISIIPSILLVKIPKKWLFMEVS